MGPHSTASGPSDVATFGGEHCGHEGERWAIGAARVCGSKAVVSHVITDADVGQQIEHVYYVHVHVAVS